MRCLPTGLIVGVVWMVAVTIAGAQEPSDVAVLKDHIAKLQQRIEQLEARLARLEGGTQPGQPAEGGAPANPGPVPSSGQPVTSDTPLNHGDVLQAFWGNQWWAAEVLEPLPDGQVRIHYTGWNASWDEVVPRSRLQLDPDAKTRVLQPGIVPQQVPVGVSGAPGPVASSGQAVNADTPLKAGDAVQTEWGGQWWAAEIVQTYENGQVKVHYTGWDASWDETVPRTRLQLHSKAAEKTRQ